MYLFTVPNMTCGGCAKSVTKALQSVDAAAKIETDPLKREVRVESSVAEADLRAVLTEAGYPADRIFYYRGGMQSWRLLGLSVTDQTG